MTDEPREAYLVLNDGTKIECLIETTGENEWQAVPVVDVHIDDVKHAYIDVLPGGGEISFLIGGVPQ